MAKGKKRSEIAAGLTVHFKQIKQGDIATIIFNPSIPFHFPKRIIGCTGIITGMKGKAYMVEIREGGKIKKFIVGAAHLKKIKS